MRRIALSAAAVAMLLFVTRTLIRLGEDGTPSDDFLFHVTGHFTQTSNGEVTSDFQKIIIECN
jgi:hypothetical protein